MNKRSEIEQGESLSVWVVQMAQEHICRILRPTFHNGIYLPHFSSDILFCPSHAVLIIVFLAFDFFLPTCFGLAGILLPKLQLKQHAHDNLDG